MENSSLSLDSLFPGNDPEDATKGIRIKLFCVGRNTRAATEAGAMIPLPGYEDADGWATVEYVNFLRIFCAEWAAACDAAGDAEWLPLVISARDPRTDDQPHYDEFGLISSVNPDKKIVLWFGAPTLYPYGNAWTFAQLYGVQSVLARILSRRVEPFACHIRSTFSADLF